MGKQQFNGFIKQGHEEEFKMVFATYFKSLHAYAFAMLKDEAIAEEMVQQTFYRFLVKKEQLQIHTSIKSYLYKSVYNECMNFLKHQKYKAAHQVHVLHRNDNEANINNSTIKLEVRELEQKINEVLNQLPQQCRTIFQMSRFEELKYRQIAEELGVSIKTVESQISKALRILRSKLIEFLPCLIVFLIQNKYL